MKIISILSYSIFLFLISLVTGCQKEALLSSETTINQVASTETVNKISKLQEHKLKGEYTTGYYSFVPDLAAGYVYPNPAPGWYPGVATKGHLNLLGQSQAFVNMYATFGTGGLQGSPAPLNLFFANELNAMGIVLPDAVALLVFDKHGNSIWARDKGTIMITPVSATRVMFSVDAEILGGTGKFANATGDFIGTGYFNPQDSNDVGFVITSGKIIY